MSKCAKNCSQLSPHHSPAYIPSQAAAAPLLEIPHVTLEFSISFPYVCLFKILSVPISQNLLPAHTFKSLKIPLEVVKYVLLAGLPRMENHSEKGPEKVMSRGIRVAAPATRKKYFCTSQDISKAILNGQVLNLGLILIRFTALWAVTEFEEETRLYNVFFRKFPSLSFQGEEADMLSVALEFIITFRDRNGSLRDQDTHSGL